VGLFWCPSGGLPDVHETGGPGTTTERQRDTKVATVTERPVRGRGRVRGSQINDGQPHRYFLPWSGDDPRLVLFPRSPTITLNAQNEATSRELLFVTSDRTRVIPWIPRSRDSARRGARISGQ